MENVESAKSQRPDDMNVDYLAELIANILLITVLQFIQLSSPPRHVPAVRGLSKWDCTCVHVAP